MGLTAPVLMMGRMDSRPVSAWVTATVLTGSPLVQVCTGSWLPLRFTTLSLLKPLVLGSELGSDSSDQLGSDSSDQLIGLSESVPMSGAVVGAVFAVVVLVWVGLWVQVLPCMGLTAPVLMMGRMDSRPVSAWVTATVLTGSPLVQVCTGSWLPLRFTTLSLLKPLVLGSELGSDSSDQLGSDSSDQLIGLSESVPMSGAVVGAVFAVVVLVWVGLWVQVLPCIGLTAPVLMMGRMDARPSVSVWVLVTVLTGAPLVQVCTGSW